MVPFDFLFPRFDEILAGKALFMYKRGIFFIDAFPPLAKLLYTFVGE